MTTGVMLAGTSEEWSAESGVEQGDGADYSIRMEQLLIWKDVGDLQCRLGAVSRALRGTLDTGASRRNEAESGCC